jgi:mycothiol system anti-sigma-R factor
MDCTDSLSRLDAYLDQELDPPGITAIDEHLATCGACKEIFGAQSALQSGIRRHATYYNAPERLKERIRAGIGSPARRSFGWQWPKLPQLQFGAALAATAVVSWIAAVEYTAPREDDLIMEQVMSGHARAVVTSHVADVASTDQHTVKPWLSGKLDFSPPVNDLAGAGFPLVGGRVDYIGNRTVAALVYRHREHLIDVFVWPERKAGRTTPIHSPSGQGYNVVHWTDSGLAFWAVSDLNAVEMKSFVEAYSRGG